MNGGRDRSSFSDCDGRMAFDEVRDVRYIPSNDPAAVPVPLPGYHGRRNDPAGDDQPAAESVATTPGPAA